MNQLKSSVKITLVLLMAGALSLQSCRDRTEEGPGSPIDEQFNDGQLGTLTDIDGNEYVTVKIGRWWWMAENLKVTRYADGEDIPSNQMFIYIGDTVLFPAYKETEQTLATHGRLYTLSAARRGTTSSASIPSGLQGVCPTGWHVPSDDEFKLIERRAGLSITEVELLDFRSTAGGRLKSTSPHWRAPNTGAINDLGFSALPTGFRRNSPQQGQIFFSDSLNAYYWTTTDVSPEDAANNPVLLTRTHTRVLNYQLPAIGRVPQARTFALSVRCVRDEPED
ncbi:MAG: fibrobacter succinogenes major paralogous domain-containing protein [Luteibaculaceae bacterium]